MTEYTNIEVIVMEDEDGSEVEMQLVDEFDYHDAHYLALSAPITEDEADDEDTVSFFEEVSEEDEELELALVEDEALIEALADLLEERLLSR